MEEQIPCGFCGQTGNVIVIGVSITNLERGYTIKKPLCHVCCNQIRLCSNGLEKMEET